MGKKIDFEDLMRLAKDTDYDDEFTSNLDSLLEREDLTAKEILKLWECRGAWESAWDQAGTSMWESIGEYDGKFALRAYFCEDATTALWNKVCGSIPWSNTDARWTFFSGLPAKNPSSKILLDALSRMTDNGISESNLEHLRECAYFKETMLEKCGVSVNEDED